MAVDYSEMRIGPPREVFENLAHRLGELNFNSANMKLGVSDSPCQAHGAQGGERVWPVMKMLYLTHSPIQAREMADLLRAWDAKLFLDLEWDAEEEADGLGRGGAGAHPRRQRGRHAPGRHSASFYAFALIR